MNNQSLLEKLKKAESETQIRALCDEHGFKRGEVVLGGADELLSAAVRIVTGNVNVVVDAELDAPKLETVGGDLNLFRDAKVDAPNLQTVGDDVNVYGDAKLDAPKLQTVGGYVFVYGKAKLDALQTIGGSVHVSGCAKLDAPKLQTVGGYVSVYGEAKLDRLKLKNSGEARSVWGTVYKILVEHLSRLQPETVDTKPSTINKAELVEWLEGRIGKSTVSRTGSHLFSRGQRDAFQEVLDHIKGEEEER